MYKELGQSRFDTTSAKTKIHINKESIMNIRIIGIDLAVSAKHKAVVLDPAGNKFIGKQISFRSRPMTWSEY